jgi:hypothetical protein
MRELMRNIRPLTSLGVAIVMKYRAFSAVATYKNRNCREMFLSDMQKIPNSIWL